MRRGDCVEEPCLTLYHRLCLFFIVFSLQILISLFFSSLTHILWSESASCLICRVFTEPSKRHKGKQRVIWWAWETSVINFFLISSIIIFAYVSLGLGCRFCVAIQAPVRRRNPDILSLSSKAAWLVSRWWLLLLRSVDHLWGIVRRHKVRENCFIRTFNQIYHHS